MLVEPSEEGLESIIGRKLGSYSWLP